jgi:hypothetical protein
MSLANFRKVTKGDEKGIDPWSVNYYWDGTKWVIQNSDQQPDPQEELLTE